MQLMNEATLLEDAIELEVSVAVEGLPSAGQLCQELALLLARRARDEDVVREMREIIGVPPEFQIRVGLAGPDQVVADPVVIAPSDLPDLTVLAQDCVECSAYSWSKGCDSWPW